MPGLPLPLWYRELPQTGGATAVARAGANVAYIIQGGASGGRSVASAGGPSHPVARMPAGGRSTSSAGGGQFLIDLRATGGGRAIERAGGSISSRVDITGGASLVDSAGGVARPVLRLPGGADGEASAGGQLLLWLLRTGGASTSARSGGAHTVDTLRTGGATLRLVAGGLGRAEFPPSLGVRLGPGRWAGRHGTSTGRVLVPVGRHGAKTMTPVSSTTGRTGTLLRKVPQRDPGAHR